MPEFVNPSFHLPQEAVVQFQDVVGDPVLDPNIGLMPYGDPDADAYLFGQAGNDGYFSNVQFPIGRFPGAANHYGLVLPQLRETQRRILLRDGIDPDTVVDLDTIHPDAAKTIRSLGKVLVAVANHAPRKEGQERGAPFYAALLGDNIEVYGHAPFLTAAEAHGKITALYEVRPDMFRKGEFFRSKEVATARRDADRWLEVRTDSERAEIIPMKDAAYPRFVDRFGNVLIDAPKEIVDGLEPGSTVEVTVGGAYLGDIPVVEDLDQARTGELQLMVDTEQDPGSSRGSLFLVRKVDDPTAEAGVNSAYIAVADALSSNHPEGKFKLRTLDSNEVHFGEAA